MKEHRVDYSIRDLPLKDRVKASASTPEGLTTPSKPVSADDEKLKDRSVRLDFSWVVDAVLCAFQTQFEAFRALLSTYVTTLSVQNAWGVTSTIDMCRLCSGGGIHNMGCACPCHPARRLLAQVDEARSQGKIITLR